MEMTKSVYADPFAWQAIHDDILPGLHDTVERLKRYNANRLTPTPRPALLTEDEWREEKEHIEYDHFVAHYER